MDSLKQFETHDDDGFYASLCMSWTVDSVILFRRQTDLNENQVKLT